MFISVGFVFVTPHFFSANVLIVLHILHIARSVGSMRENRRMIILYYAVISAAVVMFGVQFLLNKEFQKLCGNTLRATLVLSLLTSAVGAAVLFAVNKFRLEFTLFSLLVAVWMAVNNLAFTFCSQKAFGRINLSLYSVFSMLGGMMLPFIAGLTFFDEKPTLGKGICIVLVAAALLLTVRRDDRKGGVGWYVGIFVLNGMSGVISKVFQALPYEKTSDAGFSVLTAVVSVLISGVWLLFSKEKKIKLGRNGLLLSVGSGLLGRVGNFLLLIALSNLPASAQYPFVTGGVMIVSTVICFFTKEKPTKREILSVAVSFAGILALVLL